MTVVHGRALLDFLVVVIVLESKGLYNSILKLQENASLWQGGVFQLSLSLFFWRSTREV